MTQINIKVDATLKKEAESLFKDLGLSLSAAITVFLKQAVKQKKIPFELTNTVSQPDDFFNNPKNLERLMKSIAQANNNEFVSISPDKL